MPAPSQGPSPADNAIELADLSVGVGVMTLQLIPLALPGVALVVAPIALLAVAGALLAVVCALLVTPILVPLLVLRRVRRR
jgi:hypothetical protein